MRAGVVALAVWGVVPVAHAGQTVTWTELDVGVVNPGRGLSYGERMSSASTASCVGGDDNDTCRERCTAARQSWSRGEVPADACPGFDPNANLLQQFTTVNEVGLLWHEVTGCGEEANLATCGVYDDPLPHDTMDLRAFDGDQSVVNIAVLKGGAQIDTDGSFPLVDAYDRDPMTGERLTDAGGNPVLLAAPDVLDDATEPCWAAPGGPTCEIPYWDDVRNFDVLRDFLDEFHAAYNGNGRMVAVDISTVGHAFGEWHNAFDSALLAEDGTDEARLAATWETCSAGMSPQQCYDARAWQRPYLDDYLCRAWDVPLLAQIGEYPSVEFDGLPLVYEASAPDSCFSPYTAADWGSAADGVDPYNQTWYATHHPGLDDDLTVGWRGNCFGPSGSRDELYDDLVAQFDLGDVWQQGPVVLETCGWVKTWPVEYLGRAAGATECDALEACTGGDLFESTCSTEADPVCFACPGWDAAQPLKHEACLAAGNADWGTIGSAVKAALPPPGLRKTDPARYRAEVWEVIETYQVDTSACLRQDLQEALDLHASQFNLKEHDATSPWGYDFCGSGGAEGDADSGQDTLDQILDGMPATNAAWGGDAWTDLFNAFEHRLGYRIGLVETTLERVGGDLVIHATWQNSGVAPVYGGLQPVVRFVALNGDVTVPEVTASEPFAMGAAACASPAEGELTCEGTDDGFCDCDPAELETTWTVGVPSSVTARVQVALFTPAGWEASGSYGTVVRTEAWGKSSLIPLTVRLPSEGDGVLTGREVVELLGACDNASRCDGLDFGTVVAAEPPGVAGSEMYAFPDAAGGLASAFDWHSLGWVYWYDLGTLGGAMTR